MIPKQHFQVLATIVEALRDRQIDWVITGSLGMALHGMPLNPHDIDLQTDKNGVYEIEEIFKSNVVAPLAFRSSDRLQSYFGKLEIDGIKVDIMGDLQKRNDDLTWEEPVKVEDYREWLEYSGIMVPVMQLEYEYLAYTKMGRIERARLLRDWLDKSK